MSVASAITNQNYTPQPYSSNGYKSFAEFYPFYLGEHSHETNRRLHLIGTLFTVSLLIWGLLIGPLARFMLAGIIQGYSFAWIGHFFFEKNKPATFKHPFYSVCHVLI